MITTNRNKHNNYYRIVKLKTEKMNINIIIIDCDGVQSCTLPSLLIMRHVNYSILKIFGGIGGGSSEFNTTVCNCGISLISTSITIGSFPVYV